MTTLPAIRLESLLLLLPECEGRGGAVDSMA